MFSFTEALRSAPSGGVYGSGPGDFMEGPDGNFYGTIRGYPSFLYVPSQVFKMTPDGWLTPFYTFGPGTDGNYVSLKFAGLDGKLYGTTSAGGTDGCGTIFRLGMDGQLSNLVEFTGTSGSRKGKTPSGLLQAKNGTIYGATAEGGEYGFGTIFKIVSPGVIETLAVFSGTTGSAKGASPNMLMQASDGSIYGTTSSGGSENFGTLFKITTAGVLSSIEFTGTGGIHPGAGPGNLIQAADGNIYGTATAGGTNNSGTFFQLTTGGTLNNLHHFDAARGRPYFGLRQGYDGTIYGTTGYPGGSIYKRSPAGQVSIVYDFSTAPADAHLTSPSSPLLLGSDGYFYGTTEATYANSYGYYWGAVYRLDAAGNNMTTIKAFFGDIASAVPIGPGNLVQGRNGSIYGTTDDGGIGKTNGGGRGTVFKIGEPDGLEIIAQFGISINTDIPAQPHAGIIRGMGSDGNFYGTSTYGGRHDLGTVYKLTPSGELTTLGSFGGADTFGSNFGPFAGLYPVSDLIDVGDGSLYGTTTSTRGNIDSFHPALAFRITKDGQTSTLNDFYINYGTSQMELSPRNGLTKGTDGFFYGTVAGGYLGYSLGWDPNSAGAIFRMTASGEINKLADFVGGAVGKTPGSKLLEVSESGSSTFYGTTLAGGNSGDGAIFKLTSSGTLTSLASLQDSIGGYFSSADWLNIPIGNRNGIFELSYTIRPQTSNAVDAVTGLAQGNADEYPDLACVVRLNTNGFFDVRNGNVYQATNQIPYSINSIRDYQVVMTVNLPAKTYSVTLDGVTLASNFSFRTEQLGVGGLDTLVLKTESGTNIHKISNITSVSSAQGSYPLGDLIRGSDGNFYGTAVKGGGFGHGTVFRVTPGGVLTKLLDFTGNGAANKGSQPVTGLLEFDDGYFYGTTSAGGSQNLGTLFRVSSAGALETLFDFGADAEDSMPLGKLVRGADGNLYGTTRGSAGGSGAVYRLIFDGKPSIYNLTTSEKIFGAASLRCKVNPRGSPCIAWVEYWTDGTNPPLVPLSSYLTGYKTMELSATLQGLARGTTYHYRFGASNLQYGTTYSDVMSFETIGLPVTGIKPATNVLKNSAILHAEVSAANSTTSLAFEYWRDGTAAVSLVPANPGTISGVNLMATSAPLVQLDADTTYHYRIVGINEAGTANSGTATFTTLTEPTATVGGAFALSTTSVRVEGAVNARGSEGINVAFEFGIGETVLGSVTATPAVMGGVSDTPVHAILDNLNQGTEYFYRVKATAPGLNGESGTATFTMNVLSGFARDFPDSPPQSQGFIIVNLTPPGVGGWRFTGEQVWRAPGIPVGGLTTSDRVVEFMPVNGYIQPPPEPVSIISGGVPTYLNLAYVYSGQGGSGGLSVTLKPASLADTNLPEAERAQWRLFKLGTNTDPWRNSDAALNGLLPGNYLIECKPVAGRTTPSPSAVMVEDGATSTKTIVYYLKDPQTGAYPLLLPFETVSTGTNLPYGYVGQIRSDAGSSSGFVVRSRVVVTAGHAIFDEETLSTVTGLQWLLQRDSASHEPKPLIPRGAHLLDDYAAARAVPGTVPGSGTPSSQNRDAATLYFGEDAGRGGFSGYLASDAVENEFLESAAAKMLVGYPVSGEGYVSGRMYATAAMNAGFTRVLALDEFGNPFRTYRTSDIRGTGGMSGGPLCVQFEGGIYYPAAIYLGGSNETVVRTIDSKVIDIINSAEVSSVAGDNNTGGGITFSSFTTFSASTDPYGALRVTIKPAAAQTARWRINSGIWRNSGYQQALLASGSPYTLELETVSGLSVPATQSVEIKSGKIRDITFTYGQDLTAMESWRLTHFGTSTNTGNSADDADPDGDGSANRSEYAAATNPNSAMDVFKILTTEKTSGSFTATVAGKAGRRYVLQRSASLAGGSWSNIASIGPLSANQSVPLTDPNPPSSSGFYRMAVSVP